MKSEIPLIGSSTANFRSDLCIDIRTNKVMPIPGRFSPLGLAFKLTWFAAALATAAIVAIFFWPLGLFLAFTSFFILQKKPPPATLNGLWEGACPLCSSNIFAHGPPKAEDMAVNCPMCTRPLVLRHRAFHPGSPRAPATPGT